MPAKIQVSLHAFVISISIIILSILFWLFYKNATHISSILDKKLSLEHNVNALALLISEIALQCVTVPDTTTGAIITAQTCPALYAMLNAVERIHLLNDQKVYVFIIDMSGNQVVNGGSVSLASKNESRPGMNTMNYTDTDGNKVVKMILDRAQAGGGYVEYLWPDPVTKQCVKKLAFVKLVPNTQWVLGAGLYI